MAPKKSVPGKNVPREAKTYRLSVDERLLLSLYHSAPPVCQGLVVETLMKAFPTVTSRRVGILAGSLSAAHLVRFREAARAKVLQSQGAR